MVQGGFPKREVISLVLIFGFLIIYPHTQMTEKYSTAMCYPVSIREREDIDRGDLIAEDDVDADADDGGGGVH